MAHHPQLQYTPVTGPVWTEPVAEKLAWLPRGQQPARERPPHRLGWYCRPEFEALYRPEGLQWTPEDRYAGREAPRARPDWTVLVQLAVAPPFDPQKLEWLPRGSYPQVPQERRILGAFAQPSFEALYRPERLEWRVEQVYFGRSLPRAALDWTVLQRPIVAAFDPQSLTWLPRGNERHARLERRILGAFVQPHFEALYKPERMEWALDGQQPARRLPGIFAGSWISDPTTPAPPVITDTGIRLEFTLVADRNEFHLQQDPEEYVVQVDRAKFRILH